MATTSDDKKGVGNRRKCGWGHTSLATLLVELRFLTYYFDGGAILAYIVGVMLVILSDIRKSIEAGDKITSPIIMDAVEALTNGSLHKIGNFCNATTTLNGCIYEMWMSGTIYWGVLMIISFAMCFAMRAASHWKCVSIMITWCIIHLINICGLTTLVVASLVYAHSIMQPYIVIVLCFVIIWRFLTVCIVLETITAIFNEKKKGSTGKSALAALTSGDGNGEGESDDDSGLEMKGIGAAGQEAKKPTIPAAGDGDESV